MEWCGVLGYLFVRGGHKSEELIDVAHSQPVRVELHGSLHLLGVEKIPHYSGHSPPCGSGGKTPPKEEIRGVTIYASIGP